MRVWGAIFLLLVSVAVAAAETSLRPQARPSASGDGSSSTAKAPAPSVQSATPAAERDTRVVRSLRPKLRPRKFRRIARQQERLRKRGGVCGDVDIQGEVIGRVKGRLTGCGVSDAVKIRTVSGVALSSPSTMDCTTAQALKAWVNDTAKPALQRSGGGLKSLRIAAHYACRTRNSLPGARISEHGKGRAIDVSALRLQDGTLITVRNGWNGKETGKILRSLHAGACGPFGTVLGPEANRFHLDHFHFDTARYRSGPYCR